MTEERGMLRLISGVGVKGPACFLLDTAGRRFMLDLGEGPPAGLLPKVDDLGPIDALILTHGHKDHVGGLSLLAKLGNPPVYATEIVARGLPEGIAARPLPLRGKTEVLGVSIETGRNGHAPGGVWISFAAGGGFLYTGDYSTESILYAYDPPQKKVGTVLLDASYAGYQKAIAECWENLTPFVEHRPLLLPVPANGRGPEIALELVRHGCNEIFVDNAMQAALQRLSDSAGRSVRPTASNDIKKLTAMTKPIANPRGVMLAASADGTSGATAQLLAQWERTAEPSIVFTGYMPPGSPADRLIKNGRAQFVRWNVHPLLSDTVTLVRGIQAKTVVPAFCDRSQFATLAAALAPARVTMDSPVEI